MPACCGRSAWRCSAVSPVRRETKLPAAIKPNPRGFSEKTHLDVRLFYSRLGDTRISVLDLKFFFPRYVHVTVARLIAILAAWLEKK